MGREVRRIALDFNWPVNKVWEGFLNPLYKAHKCWACDGSGWSRTAKRLADQWYGNAPFKPEDRGSEPFRPTDKAIRAFAERNVTRSPDFYGRGEGVIKREAERLCDLFNRGWNHHVNADDVAALIKASRLYDFTHTWTKGKGWQPKSPAVVPTPQAVNIWSISGMGHDSINQHVCVKAECERLGEAAICKACDGAGDIWPSKEAEEAYEAWEKTDPPKGDGYQIWETVSEGSPISPVFSAPEDLARHMAGTKWGADDGTPYETWLKFIRGPGWAPSGVMVNGKFMSGVEAAAAQ